VTSLILTLPLPLLLCLFLFPLPRFLLLLLSLFFLPKILLFPLLRLLVLLSTLPSLYPLIAFSSSLTGQPAPFVLVGTLCKLICRNPFLLRLLALPMAIAAATSLATILTTLLFPTHPVVGGSSGIASLPLPLMTSNLVPAFSSTLLLPRTLLPTLPGLMSFLSLTHLSASLARCPLLTLLLIPPAALLPSVRRFLSTFGLPLLLSASLAASFRLSFPHLLLLAPVGPALHDLPLNLFFICSAAVRPSAAAAAAVRRCRRCCCPLLPLPLLLLLLLLLFY